MGNALLVAVVADEFEEQALAIAAREGACQATTLAGRGINFPEHVTFFGLTYQGLERVCLWVLEEERATHVAECLNRELELLKPFKGLAFCLKIDDGHAPP
ncbi:hypothetical protein CKO35_06430 [Ectothiorhodospira shaposhnikovii]|uniref:hypothetical protein n=1 Tax=Ectothiorhodospira shaposhnikovii TaxID=1054 RepID=UPI001908DB98|nr:hypothetical protein [Ectothiorhodospira shaposhnikovii]MBK1672947.1 hypothetical protein [Ectothiorhodospira shaposhnikovii]